MERLTERFGGRYIAIKGCLTAYKDDERKGAPAANDIVRLSAYEDTGLTPEDIDVLKKREQGLAELLVNVSCGCAVSYTRLAELAQAEKDGRLVVLPVRPGTKVCRIKHNFGNYELVDEYYHLSYYGPEEFLIATFKTREEAEAALKNKEADDETD